MNNEELINEARIHANYLRGNHTNEPTIPAAQLFEELADAMSRTNAWRFVNEDDFSDWREANMDEMIREGFGQSSVAALRLAFFAGSIKSLKAR